MSRSIVCLLTLSAGLLLWSGCEDAPPAAPAPQPGSPPPPAAIDIGTPTAASGAALPLPPGVTRSIADLPVAAAAPGLPVADPAGPLRSLVNEGNVFFYDKDDNFLPKDPVDFLQRAIQNYMNERKYNADDDSPEWPMMTDLSLLVKYRIIRALPAPPAGQKFVLDPQTRKVSLVPQ